MDTFGRDHDRPFEPGAGVWKAKQDVRREALRSALLLLWASFASRPSPLKGVRPRRLLSQQVLP